MEGSQEQPSGPDPFEGAAELHDDLLRNFAETGMYDLASDLGIIQNGHLSDFWTPQPDERTTHPNLGSPNETKAGNLRGTVSGNKRPGEAARAAEAAANAARKRLAESTPGYVAPDTREESPVEQEELLHSKAKKLKKGHRPTQEKTGKGLRHFSMKVCEKVESKGRTTYNEVADELVGEFTSGAMGDGIQYDEKNIRRRVYDALNVLMAMEIISKDKKEIQWKGLPSTTDADIEQMRAERLRSLARFEKKRAYLNELVEQHDSLKALLQSNRENPKAESTTGIHLPFILVQTKPNATIEIEMSEDMQLVHFDFNNSPFEIHDDSYVLKKMAEKDKTLTGYCEASGLGGGGQEFFQQAESSDQAFFTQAAGLSSPAKHLPLDRLQEMHTPPNTSGKH